MQREEKSERSRRHVLDAALQLFSTRGYRATSVRDIADAAGVSTGNVYHHFPDKETIFTTLLGEIGEIAGTPRFPFHRALSRGHFPDNLENLGFAARQSVIEFKSYFALIYVDVIEFEGAHIRDFFGGIPQRFSDFLLEEGTEPEIVARLRPGVSPISALVYASRLLFNYFSVEVLFNVPPPFGKDSAEVVKDIADILRNGVAAK